MRKTLRARRRALLTAAASVLTATGAYAQGSVFSDEIVVTAQKREENAQDVGISITAFSGEQLQALGYTNAQEVTALAARRRDAAAERRGELRDRDSGRHQ